jgi:non-heme chloroperoxidase
MVVRHSTGGEVERYIGRHCTRRVAGAVLATAVSPIMLKSVINPEVLPNGRIVGTRFAIT